MNAIGDVFTYSARFGSHSRVECTLVDFITICDTFSSLGAGICRRDRGDGPAQKKGRKQKKIRAALRSESFRHLCPLVHSHTHSHLLQSISRLALKGTPTKFQSSSLAIVNLEPCCLRTTQKAATLLFNHCCSVVYVFLTNHRRYSLTNGLSSCTRSCIC